MKRIGILFYMIVLPVFTQDRTFIGYAYDKQSGKLIYTENYYLYYKDNKIFKQEIVYKDSDNKIIAKKVLNFSKNSQIPVFELQDFRTGYIEGCRYLNEQFQLYYKEKNSDYQYSSFFNFSDLTTVDSGIHYFILNHLEDLKKGKRIYFQLGVPSRLNLIPFVIYKQQEISEKKVLRIFIEIDNIFLKFLLSPVIAEYNLLSKDLLLYQGISNLYDEYGKAYDVKIVYKY